MRLKLTIEYAGTRYSGWQIQKNARTVQGELERAIREAAGVSDFELYGSGRTDAGVHALAQVAHLDIDVSGAAELLRRRINDALPSDINVLRAEKVRHRFHARHDARARPGRLRASRRAGRGRDHFPYGGKTARLAEAAQARAAARIVAVIVR